ncbi:MAG: hypothetical protein HOH01_03175, partial [Candidatus Jacksonbacteria bacterium]|nr:hypothetical protein [Candidatus Jacksonbacteria bacterium]
MVGSSDQLCGGKVAIVSATFAPITGGMAQATYYHAALLSQYGHDVTLFTQSGFSDSNSQMNFDKQFSFRITRLDPVYSKGFAA